LTIYYHYDGGGCLEPQASVSGDDPTAILPPCLEPQ